MRATRNTPTVAADNDITMGRNATPAITPDRTASVIAVTKPKPTSTNSVMSIAPRQAAKIYSDNGE